MHRPACAITLFALLCCAHPAYADTLLIQRVQQTPAQAPARGQTTGEVQARLGTPTEKLEPRGGQRQQWPVIQRWVYPAFTVYFEKNRVIDVVAHQASPEEIGPKPPIK